MYLYSLRSAFASLAYVVVFSAACLPTRALADPVPPAVIALFPKETTFDRGEWAVMATEFGKTFVGDLHAESFPGRSPSCDLAAVPLLRINLKGDTAFEQPPMLEMVVADFEQSVVRAAQSLAPVLTYAGTEPGVVAVGEIHEETRPNGHLAYVQFQEDCRLHPNGYKTSLKGLARRGATQLSFELLLALDSVATVSIAEEILANFDSLDIAALTE